MHFRYWINSQWVYIQSLQANKGLKDSFPIKIHLAQSYEIIISFYQSYGIIYTITLIKRNKSSSPF